MNHRLAKLEKVLRGLRCPRCGRCADDDARSSTAFDNELKNLSDAAVAEVFAVAKRFSTNCPGCGRLAVDFTGATDEELDRIGRALGIEADLPPFDPEPARTT